MYWGIGTLIIIIMGSRINRSSGYSLASELRFIRH